ncbi:MAG TPA: protein kinase [Gemmatimonas sp.]|nr:protein kinase [Gemmatimonas sp.]
MTDVVTRVTAALGDRYQLVRELSGGGMARVWLARERALGRDVVVKLVGDGAGLSAERFAREVQLAARLQQANIVPLLTAGDADGVPYYTMPYVDGQSLRDRLARGPLPMADALDVLRDVARALAYAHAQGVIHRDIKPENILLSSGAAVVTDFGIAKAVSVARTAERSAGAAHASAITQAGTSLGTPGYVAPEQALGEAADARADVYAWGVVAYELLAAQHPFAHHTTASKLVAAHLSETPAPLPATIPRAVAALVVECLAKDPDARPARAADLLQRLDDARASSSAHVGGDNASRRARSTTGNSRTRALTIGALALSVVVIGAVIVRQRSVAAATATASTARTVVVMPFENLGNAQDAYFASGVSDEIAGQLARLPGIQVIGRDGVQSAKAAGRPALDVARELGAAWVLSGSVRWARESAAQGGVVDGSTRVRIVPVLLNVQSGAQVWGEPLEERLTDVFRVQGAVAERVATALSVTLTGGQRASLQRAESQNAAARDAQLLGRNLLRQRGLANLLRAEAQFARAVALDSGYARAWAGLSETILVRRLYGDTTESMAAGLARAELAAQRAVQLDSTLPEVRLAVARTLQRQFRLREALAESERAIALDSSNGLAWLLRAETFSGLGRVAEAQGAGRRAMASDPFSAVSLMFTATTYFALGQLDSAEALNRRAVELDPAEPYWRHAHAVTLSALGRLREANAECRFSADKAKLCELGWGVELAQPEPRSRLRSELDGLAGTRNNNVAMWGALGYARLGELDSAFSRVSAAIENRDDAWHYWSPYLETTPMGKDPRWERIVVGMRRR